MYKVILHIAVAYILLCKLSYGTMITSCIFINILQMEHFGTTKNFPWTDLLELNHTLILYQFKTLVYLLLSNALLLSSRI